MTATLATTAISRPHPSPPRRGDTPAPLSASGAAILIVYLAAIVAAEIAIVQWPLYGMFAHNAILATLLAHAGLTGDSAMRRATLVLTLGPLVRIMSVAMPLGQLPSQSWYAVISIPLFVAAFVIARLLGLGRRELGLTLDLSWRQWLIASVGIPLGLIEYVILRPTPMASSFTLGAIWFPALVLMVSTGFLEEFIFRGLFQHVALELAGTLGIVFVSVLFAVLHIGYWSLLDVIFVFLAAQLFATAARATRSLTGVTVAHGLTNIMLFLVFPFLLGG